MIRTISAFALAVALFAAPVTAADVGHDCAEGEDDYVPAPQQTPMPPAPGS